MFHSDLDNLVNMHDRYDEARRRALGVGIDSVYTGVTTSWLTEASKLTNSPIVQTADGAGLALKYRGLTFVAKRPKGRKGGAPCR